MKTGPRFMPVKCRDCPAIIWVRMEPPQTGKICLECIGKWAAFWESRIEREPRARTPEEKA